jgi:hypothetical protein
MVVAGHGLGLLWLRATAVAINLPHGMVSGAALRPSSMGGAAPELAREEMTRRAQYCSR